MARGKGAKILLRVAAMAAAVLMLLVLDGESVRAQQSAYLLDLLAGGTGAELGGSPGMPAAVTSRTPLEGDFAMYQLQFERVRRARIDTRFGIKQLFRDRGITYPAADVFLRIFKRDRLLELWVRPHDAETFALLKTYTICALAGELGPKRSQGDGQTPEGFYQIDFFNPQSEFHLSLHLDYPNRSDALLGRRGGLGGDIFIHGGCVTEGCLAVTDESIKELYWIAVEARSGGQRRIPVHIFPARLDDAEMQRLDVAFADEPELRRFWRNLRPGYEYFEQHRKLPAIRVNDRGAYRIAGEPEHGPDDPPVAAPAQQTASSARSR